MDFTPTVLDGGNEVISANWPNDTHIIRNINNDIPIKIPSQPYVLVNRSVLRNWCIEAETIFFWNHWLHVKIVVPNELRILLLIQLLSTI